MDIEVKMPDVGLEKVEVIEILVKIGEKVKFEQGLITVEGEKASMEVPSPQSGIVKHIFIKIGDKIRTSSILMILKGNEIHDNIEKNTENILNSNIFNKNIKNDSAITGVNLIHATPFVRRLARNLNIDLHNIKPTGPKNRILKEDLELYLKKFKNVSQNNKFNLDQVQNTQFKQIELSNLQKIIGSNLQKNWKNIPHVTQFEEVNITILEKFRKKYNSQINDEKTSKVTILVFILKVVSYALQKFPIFNSSLCNESKKIILKKDINIGVAVDVQDSLFVPVLKNVNKKNISELSSELNSLVKKSNEKKLKKSDISEGSFTISNLGSIGGSWFSPIINAPEVAILGVSKATIKPFWNGEKFIPVLMLPLSLSYDHRVINGAYAARFITFINKLLSDMHFLLM